MTGGIKIISEINIIREKLKEKNPLVHCITNPISINQCANAVLAVGGRPIMAEHPKEVYEITETASSVMLNIANITDARMESIKKSAECCAKNNIPFVLDIAGYACSSLRRGYVDDLLKIAVPNIIKGNYSEIRSLFGGYTSVGVDSEDIGVAEIERVSAVLARKYKKVILASGKTDVITDGKRLFRVFNGTPMLSRITGTGCMQGALCGTFLSVCEPIYAAVTSAVIMGICGESAETEKGNGSFMVNFMDKLSTVTDGEVEEKIRMEEISIEI